MTLSPERRDPPPAPAPLVGEKAPLWMIAALAATGGLLAMVSAYAGLAWPPAAAPPPPPPTAEARARLALDEMLRRQPAVVVETAAPAPPVVAARETAAPAPAPAAAPCFPALDILFPHASAQLRSEALEKSLDRLRRWLDSHPESMALIEGHADATGRERHNVLLSYQRAKAVEAWLAAAGLPARRLAVRAAGSGGAREAAAGAGEAALAADRRVSVRIDGVDVCKDGAGAAEAP